MLKNSRKILLLLTALLILGGLGTGIYLLIQRSNNNIVSVRPVAPKPVTEKDIKAQALANSGNEKASKKDYKAAIADWSDSIRLNPVYFLASYNNDIINGEALKLKFDDPKDYGDRGLIKYTLGDKQGSIKDWSDSIALKPDFSLAYFNRGVAKFVLGDIKSAIDDYNEAIKLDRNWGIRSLAAAYYNRGYAKSKLGDRQGAIMDYEKAAPLFQQQGNNEKYKSALDLAKQLK
jgi:tetratricopeptide (TPR) repeat protein